MATTILSDPDNNTLNGSRYPDLIGGIRSTKSNRILLDNMSNWYLFNGEILMGLPFLRKYENIIMTNLARYKVKREYKLRPEYVSYDLYGTTDFWYLLLFINQMKSPSEFVKDEIWVFDFTTIETLNKIWLKEKPNRSTQANPRWLTKSIMRNLNEPSYRVVKEDNSYTPWNNLPRFKNDRDLLFKSNFNRYTNAHIRGRLLNKDGEEVDPFRLNGKGLFNVPSVYFRDGYWQTNSGKIQLEKGKVYSFFKFYNGYASLSLKRQDQENIELMPLENVKHELWEPKLIADYRDGNEDDMGGMFTTTTTLSFAAPDTSDNSDSNDKDKYTKSAKTNTGEYIIQHVGSDYARSALSRDASTATTPISVTEGDNPYISSYTVQPVASMIFGRYNKRNSDEKDPSKSNHDLTGTTTGTFNPTTYDSYFPEDFHYNVYNRRLDVSRVESDEFLSFTLEYSSTFDESTLNQIQASSYKITLMYDDGSKVEDVAYINDMPQVYNTYGYRSFLKFAMYNPKHKTNKITGIRFDALVAPKETASPTLNYEFTIYSFRVSSHTRETITQNFTVPESGWYDIVATYEYSYNGKRKIKNVSIEDDRVFNKEDLSGILWKPEIHEVSTDGSYKNFQPPMVSGRDTSINEVGVKVTNPVIIDPAPKYNKLTKLYTTDLHLADEYILTVKINHTSQNTGGGVGFLFDYDYANDLGYVLWISSVNNNPNLPEYSLYDGFDIIPSGFYEIDHKNGKMYPYFEGDDSESLFADDGFYFDPENMVIKIIKKYNRIRLFDRKSSNSDDYDYYNPFFHFTDPQDMVMNQGLGFWSIYAGTRIEVLEYYPYEYPGEYDED